MSVSASLESGAPLSVARSYRRWRFPQRFAAPVSFVAPGSERGRACRTGSWPAFRASVHSSNELGYDHCRTVGMRAGARDFEVRGYTAAETIRACGGSELGSDLG